MTRYLKCFVVALVVLSLGCGDPDVRERSVSSDQVDPNPGTMAEDSMEDAQAVRGKGTFTLPEGVFAFNAYECVTDPKEEALLGTMDFRFVGEGVTPAGRPFGIAGWQARRGEMLAQEMVVGVQPREDEPQERSIPGTDQMMPLGPVRVLNRKVLRQDDGTWERVVGSRDDPGPFLEASGMTIRGSATFTGPKAEDPRGRSADLGEGVLQVTCFSGGENGRQ